MAVTCQPPIRRNLTLMAMASMLLAFLSLLWLFPLATANAGLCRGQSLETCVSLILKNSPNRSPNNNFEGFGVWGTIPPAIVSLINSEGYLSLHSNHLTGTIPPILGSATKLTGLWLSNNMLTGQMPAALGSLRRLKLFSVFNNKLEGSIPASFGSLAGLTRYLSLPLNRLTGILPPSLGSLSQMTGLFLYSNSLTGSVPPSFGSLHSLSDTLNVDDNNLTGTLPPGLGSVAVRLSGGMRLNNNQFTGTVPPVLLAAPSFSKSINLLQEPAAPVAAVPRHPGDLDATDAQTCTSSNREQFHRTFQTLSSSPRIYYYPHFLSEEEVEEVMSLGAELTLEQGRVADGIILRMRRSKVQQVSYPRLKDSAVLKRILRRMSGETKVPTNYFDRFEVQKYEGSDREPAFYVAHHDGEQRTATFILYLNTVASGGETVFANVFRADAENRSDPLPDGTTLEGFRSLCADPRVLKVPPVRGSAVLFYSYTPHGEIDASTFHGGCPVTSAGPVKWIAQQWIHAETEPRGFYPSDL